MQWAKKQNGFTIVELLIVVVVIAILAAITIVAYNGIQSRTKASATQSAASQAAKKIMSYAALNSDTYPSDITTADVGLSNTSSTTYQYWLGSNAKAYCLTVTTNNLSYYVSNSNASPTMGACAGHGANGQAVVTNRIRNPSLELGTSDIGFMGGTGTDAATNTTTAWADSGTQALQVRKINVAGTPKGVKVMLPNALAEGDVVRWAATVRNSSSTSGARVFTAYGERNSPSYAPYNANGERVTINPGQSKRISGQATITASNAAGASMTGFGVLPVDVQFAINESYFVDSFVVTVNENLPTEYVDGNTNGWIWNGDQNNSTSSGPTP